MALTAQVEPTTLGDEDLETHQRSDSSRHLGHARDTRCDSSQACAYD